MIEAAELALPRAIVPHDLKIVTSRDLGMNIAREVAGRRGVPVSHCLGARKSSLLRSQMVNREAVGETAHTIRNRLKWSWPRIAAFIGGVDHTVARAAALDYAKAKGLETYVATTEWHAEARRLRAEGKTIREICTAMECEYSAVTWALDEDGFRDRVRQQQKAKRMARREAANV
ncbi:MAG: hypothetical protein K2Y29_15525 [Beijerinckiaceae bacterium]|nr:hypothetical protein [Beijerinckiaceae bacterium]